MPVYEIDEDGNKKELHRTQPTLEEAEARELREKQARAELIDDLVEKFLVEETAKKPKLENIQRVKKYHDIDKDELDKAWKQVLQARKS